MSYRKPNRVFLHIVESMSTQSFVGFCGVSLIPLPQVWKGGVSTMSLCNWRTPSTDTKSVGAMLSKAALQTKPALRASRIARNGKKPSHATRRRCNAAQDGSNDALERATEQVTKDLLSGKNVDVEELRKLATASARVTAARLKQEEIDKAIEEFEVQEKERTAAAVEADEDLKSAAEKYLSAADALEEATAERERALEAARKSSPFGMGAFAGGSIGQDDDSLRIERLESVKALAISAAVGALCLLPISAASEGSLLSLALGCATCGLFGVTYRYAVRKDSENIQLKSGVVAAFALARGFGEADVYIRACDGLSVKVALESALLCGESFVLILFAALGLEAALQRGFVKAFPSIED